MIFKASLRELKTPFNELKASVIINFFSFIFQDITDNQAVSDPAFYSLIILYALVIIGSVVGNVLVITAVLKSEKMRKVSESNVTAVTQCKFSPTLDLI